jgi:hypothetical protein
MAKKKKPDDEPIEPIEPIEPEHEGEPLDIVPDDDLVADDIVVDDDLVVEDLAAEDDIVVDETAEDIVVEDVAADDVVVEDTVAAEDLIVADDDLVEAAPEPDADDIDLGEIPEPPSDEPVEIDSTELLDSDAEGQPVHAADLGEQTADETMAEGEFGSSIGDDFAASLGGDEGIDVDADVEPVEAGVDTLPPDAEGPIDSTMPAEPLKPATHWLTYTLIGLNFVAAATFGYFLIQDHARRQEYRYSNLLLDFAIVGLPTTEEDSGAVAARLILPNTKVPADQLTRDVMSKRGVNFGNDPVTPVDEQFARRIPSKDLDDKILKDHFGPEQYEGEAVKTVEAELQRLGKKAVNDIKEAASDTVPPNEKEQRAQIEKLLMPLAYNTVQVEKLDKRIAEAKDLKALYIEAAQRRMAFNFLFPLEMFRPGDQKSFTLEQIGDLDAIKTDAVLQRVDDRIASALSEHFDSKLQLGEGWDNQTRDTMEKRLMASFTMLSLAHVKKPNGEKLEPKLLDRIPLVVGQYDAAVAATLYPAQVNDLNARFLEAIKYDMAGYSVKKDEKEMRAESFSDRYEHLLQEIRFEQQNILRSNRRMEDLKTDKIRLTKLHEDRTATRKEVLADIEAARAKTAKLNGELRVLQRELFGFQSRLATSEEELERINAEIRQRFLTTSATKTKKGN